MRENARSIRPAAGAGSCYLISHRFFSESGFPFPAQGSAENGHTAAITLENACELQARTIPGSSPRGGLGIVPVSIYSQSFVCLVIIFAAAFVLGLEREGARVSATELQLFPRPAAEQERQARSIWH